MIISPSKRTSLCGVNFVCVYVWMRAREKEGLQWIHELTQANRKYMKFLSRLYYTILQKKKQTWTHFRNFSSISDGILKIKRRIKDLIYRQRIWTERTTFLYRLSFLSVLWSTTIYKHEKPICKILQKCNFIITFRYVFSRNLKVISNTVSE
jgi:hypothetical protein